MKDWIDCRDKLPEVSGQYIVNIDGIVFTLDYSFYSSIWIDEDDVFMGITHWMPLPEPPQ